MPAIDPNKTASRDSVREVNKGRAKRVRKARQRLENPPPPKPPVVPPHGSTELEKGTPKAPPKEKPSKPYAAPIRDQTSPGRQRAGQVQEDVKDAKHEAGTLEGKGGSLKRKERSVQRLVELGILPSSFKSGESILSERERRAVTEKRTKAVEEATKKGFQALEPATIFAKIPAVGGALDEAAKYVTTGGGKVGHALEGAANSVSNFLADHGFGEGGGFGGANHVVASEAEKRDRRSVAQHFLKDFADAPVQAVPALWQLGAASVEAAHGDTKRARKLGKSLADDTSAGQLIAHGDPKKALRLAEEHPGNALMSAIGGYGSIGRTLGAAGRVAPSAAVRDVFSQERAPLHVHGNVSETRKYSPNALTKLAQVTYEHHQRRAGKDPNELVTQRHGAGKVNRTLAKRVHATGHANEVLRREARQRAKNIMNQAEAGMKGVKVKGRRLAPRQAVGIAGKHHEIMGLLAQRIVREGHVVDDLKKYRQFIVDHAKALGDNMPLHERKTNAALVEAISKALDDKSFTSHPDGWFHAAETYITHRNEADRELHSVGLLTDEQMAAKYLPALQVHEGVHFDPTTEKRLGQVKYEEAAKRAGGLEKETRRIDSQVTQILTRMRHGKERPRDAANLNRLSATLEAFKGQHADAMKEAKALAPRKGERTYRQNWKDGNGNPINTTEGQALADAIGAGEPGFLSHGARRHGAGAYHQGYGVRPERDRAKRTGQSVERGSSDNSWRAMTDDLVGAHGKADAAKAWDRMAREFGTGPQGMTFKGREARKTADEYAKTVSDETGVEHTAVRLTPLREQADVVQRVLDSVGDVGDLADVDYGTIMQRSLDAALAPGPGHYIVVPARALQEWRKIANGANSNDAMKVMQVLSQNFRRTVLPLSPKWLAGNLIEAGLRSLFYGHGPVDWLRGVKTLKMLEAHNPEAAQQFAARTLGGRLYGSAGRQKLHRGAEQFPEGSKLRALAHAGGVVSRYPVIRQVMGAMRKFQDGVFGMNEWLEDQFATAAIGAKVKADIRATGDSLQNAVRVQKEAMDDFVRNGLTDTNKQHEFAKHLDEVLGRYSRHSPAERYMIQTFVPFWDWYRNAMKFVLVTMPTKHPIKTALISATEETMKSEQENEGDYSAFQGGGLPGFLKGSILTPGGNRIQLQRYTPFGAFSDPLGTAGNLVLPQVSSQLAALGGLNWKGTPFTKADGSEVNGIDTLKALLYGTAASQVPGLSIAQRFREGAGSAYDDSTVLSPKVREGSKQHGAQVVSKIFNPFFPVQPDSGKKRKGKSKSSLTAGDVSDLSKAASGGSGDVSDLVKALGG